MFREPNHIIKIALHRISGEAIHIDEADNGQKCGCYCTDCGKDFEAVQGKARKREWHYRHKGDNDNISTCPGGLETALHKMAKQILVRSSSLTLPKYGTIAYSNAIAEDRHQLTRPDVTATYRSKPIYFEVAVSHFIEPEKELFFVNGAFRSIEIDLSKFNRIAAEIDIEKAVLDNPNNKRIIFWEKPFQPVVIKPKRVLPEPTPAKVALSVYAAPKAKEDGWDVLIKFMKEFPGLTLAGIIAVLYFLPKILRWVGRGLFRSLL